MRLCSPKCGLHHTAWRVQEGGRCEKWKSLGPDPETLIRWVWVGPWNLHLTSSPVVVMHSHLEKLQARGFSQSWPGGPDGLSRPPFNTLSLTFFCMTRTVFSLVATHPRSESTADGSGGGVERTTLAPEHLSQLQSLRWSLCVHLTPSTPPIHTQPRSLFSWSLPINTGTH